MDLRKWIWLLALGTAAQAQEHQVARELTGRAATGIMRG